MISLVLFTIFPFDLGKYLLKTTLSIVLIAINLRHISINPKCDLLLTSSVILNMMRITLSNCKLQYKLASNIEDVKKIQ